MVNGRALRAVLFALVCAVVQGFVLRSYLGGLRSEHASPVVAKMGMLETAADLTSSLTLLPAPHSQALFTTLPVALEVTFAAYLAVLLGTFVPVTFLIVLYSQSEARKAGLRVNK